MLSSFEKKQNFPIFLFLRKQINFKNNNERSPKLLIF